MLSRIVVAALLAGASLPALAQPQPAAPEQVAAAESALPATAAAEPAPDARAMLPANSEVRLRLDAEISSSDHRAGHSFTLTVAEDVTLAGIIVIPAGTRATGQVTWQEGRSSFGKDGSLEIAMRHIELGDRRIPLAGFHREQGEGGGRGGGLPVVGRLIARGGNAVIAQGRLFTAQIVDSIPVEIGSSATAATIAADYRPSAVATQLGRREAPGAAEAPARN